MKSNKIKFLFLDVGGVLMTNGWDHNLRREVIEKFHIELDEFTKRHDLLFQIFEMGKISFDDYLTRTIFYKPRSYSLQDIKTYIFEAVRPCREMIDYIKKVREEHRVKIAIVSNEGRELAVDRMRRFEMTSFVDFFLFSAFVKARKPDYEIYRLAMDLTQVESSEIVYIDDRSFLIEVAKEFGWHTILHENLERTRLQLEAFLRGD